MIPVCFNCGVCSDTILADSTHSISDDAIVEVVDGEQYFTVPGWICIDCAPPEIRELYWPTEERILH